MRDDPGELLVPAGGVGHPAADDQRGTRLVDQDRVDLVDDGEGVAALDHVFGAHRHVVAQVVEPELVVGPIRDVRGVGGAAAFWAETGLDQADGQAEEAVDPSHPLGIASRQIVVDGDQVDSRASERIEVDRHRRDQRLPLAGLHLGDGTAVQSPGANDLDVVVTLSQHAPCRFTHNGKSLRLEIVEGCSLRQPVPELRRLGSQRLIVERLDLRLERVDPPHQILQVL